jgi:polyisoprenoid-binding protein YceI
VNRGVLYFIIGVIAVGVIAGGAFLVSIWVQGGSGEASEAISAPELSLEDETAADSESEEAADESADSEESEDMADDSESDEMADDSEAADDADESADSEESADMADDSESDEMADDSEAADDAADESEDMAGEDSAEAARLLYRITVDESEARFELDEDLAGVRTRVTGITDQVAGDIIVDFGSPADSELGTIRVNARTLATDNSFRDRAIRGQILRSSDDAYEFIEFVPTALETLPDSAAVGDTVTFQVIGDLTVIETTLSTTFEVTVNLVAADRIEGTATTTVLRSDYGLEIPEVPSVANVTDEVMLTIDFVALQVAE